MVCDECGARFEKALLLKTENIGRVVCPVCKARGPRFEEPPELTEGMTHKFEIKDE